MSFLDVMSAIGSVIIIIGVLVLTYFASRWYARKMGAGSFGAGKYLKIVDRASLGRTGSLVIVKIEDKYYLVGVGEKDVQLLTELSDFQEMEPASAATEMPGSFGQILKGLMDKTGKRGKGDGGVE